MNYFNEETLKNYNIQKTWKGYEMDITKYNRKMYENDGIKRIDMLVTIKRKTLDQLIQWLEVYKINSDWVK